MTTHLSFSTQPGGAAVGGLLSPQPVIQRLNDADNSLSSDTTPIDVSLVTVSGGPGVLHGTTSKAGPTYTGTDLYVSGSPGVYELSAANGSSLNDVQTLVAALGGDSAVLGIWDTRYNVTPSGATVATWDDARGASGYGPQISGVGTTKPAWDATNKIITTDGSQNYLAAGNHTAFDIANNRTYVLIANIPVAANYSLTVGDVTGLTKWLTIGGSAGAARFTGSSATVYPGAPLGSARRAIFVSHSVPNYYGAGVVPSAPQMVGMIQHGIGRPSPTIGQTYYAPGSAQSAGGTNVLQVGHLASYYDALDVRAIIAIGHVITGAEWQTILTWAASYHPFTDAATSTRLIFFDGNSLVLGTNSTSGNDYPSRVMAQTGFTAFDYVNSGTGSRTGATQAAAFSTRVAPAFTGSYTKKIYIAWEICNDLSGGATAAQAVANVQAACQAAKAAGATTTVVQTCIPNGGFTGAMETARLAANTALRALPSGIDVCVDTAAISQLSNTANTTYFAADGVHLTDAGYLLVATDATYGVAPALAPYI